MNTLYIISKGMGKVSDEEIRRLEEEGRHPRVSLLEKELSADLLDERYLNERVPASRRWIYRNIPTGMAQVIEALIIQKRYDSILTQSERVGLPLALFMKWLRIKTSHLMVVSRITSGNPKKSRLKMWFLKHSKEAINRILIWSSVQRNIAIGRCGVDPMKIKLIKRGTDQKFWKPVNPSVEKNMICSVGMEMRDYPTLVEAMRPLSDIPCHIAVGEARGEIFDTVKKLYKMDEIPEHITVGRKPYEELRELYTRCRFAVVPLMRTDSDNGLTAILEAMSMGIPVICSRVEGQVDVIEEGVTGIFVPQGDPKAMRAAIKDLWNNPAKAKEMGRAAQKYIEEVHNFEQFVSAIKGEVESAAKESADEYTIQNAGARL